MYYSNFSLKNAISYLLLLLLSLLASNSTIVGADDNAPLTRDQLEEKLDKYEETFQKCHESLEYLQGRVDDSSGEDTVNLIDVSLALLGAGGIIADNVRNLREQIETYDEEDDFDTRNNNQNDDAANPNRRLHNQNPSTPLYLKIIIGIVVVSLISFIAILIWESLPKKKNKQTQKLLSPTLVNPKNA